MIAKMPMPLRWCENAEAEQVCALAVLEREPHTGAARPAKVPAESCRPSRTLPLWLLDRLRGLSPQIRRDSSWHIGLL
jgi:hypothetical protein